MTDRTKERITKVLLGLVRDIWCIRESDEKPYFNCSKCEFEDGENCRLKMFIKYKKYKDVYPQGAIVVDDEMHREDGK